MLRWTLQIEYIVRPMWTGRIWRWESVLFLCMVSEFLCFYQPLSLSSGEFTHKERSWLVIWEAGVIIEAPPGCFLMYPSALFIHFNVDICGK